MLTGLQRLIIVIWAMMMLSVLLYPPWVITYRDGTISSRHPEPHNWVWSPPCRVIYVGTNRGRAAYEPEATEPQAAAGRPVVYIDDDGGACGCWMTNGSAWSWTRGGWFCC